MDSFFDSADWCLDFVFLLVRLRLVLIRPSIVMVFVLITWVRSSPKRMTDRVSNVAKLILRGQSQSKNVFNHDVLMGM